MLFLPPIPISCTSCSLPLHFRSRAGGIDSFSYSRNKGFSLRGMILFLHRPLFMY
uniref:Uncharacterized protein n=1 Tax=Picea glauca TaxID=3330 RepID=A0A101M0K0_PICGL|nr:hypothetical protein ABT39_MTgene4100 [Picea glauca]